MTYKILKRDSETIDTENTIYSSNTTVNTFVQYDFDGVIVEVNVAHFNPKSEEDIILGIKNRAISEKEKLNKPK